MNESRPDNKRLEVNGEQDSAVGRVTKIRVALLRKHASIVRRERSWLTSPKHPHSLWGPITLHFNSHLGGFYPVGAWISRGMKLTTKPTSKAEIRSKLSCTYIPPFLHVVCRKIFILTEFKDTMLQKYQAMKTNSNWNVGWIMKFRTFHLNLSFWPRS